MYVDEERIITDEGLIQSMSALDHNQIFIALQLLELDLRADGVM